MIIQKLKKEVDDGFEIAKHYYSIISGINSLGLTEREIQLVAFTAVKGNISNGNAREEFCKLYNTTIPTINNIISKMKKLKVFIKESGKIKVNPVIALDFEKGVVLQITLSKK